MRVSGFHCLHDLLDVRQAENLKILGAQMCCPGVKNLNCLSPFICLVPCVDNDRLCQLLQQSMQDLRQTKTIFSETLRSANEATVEEEVGCEIIRKIITSGDSNASLLMMVKCLDDPPSTMYEARVKGAPTKPSTVEAVPTCVRQVN